MQTLSKRLSLGCLFLFLVLSTVGCKVVQIQCETGKCTDVPSRLAGHQNVLTKLRSANNGQERALTYILTTLHGQGWKLIEKNTPGASLQLNPQNTADGVIQITVPLAESTEDLFQDMPVMLETMQMIASVSDSMKTIYLTFGMRSPSPQKDHFQIHFKPISGRGCSPSITSVDSAGGGTPIQISCNAPALISTENQHDTWANYIDAIRGHLVPLLNATTTRP